MYKCILVQQSIAYRIEAKEEYIYQQHDVKKHVMMHTPYSIHLNIHPMFPQHLPSALEFLRFCARRKTIVDWNLYKHTTLCIFILYNQISQYIHLIEKALQNNTHEHTFFTYMKWRNDFAFSLNFIQFVGSS